MTVEHGFELIREEVIAELNTQAKYYRHIQTGAEFLSLENDDENKVFGVAFRTPPTDSTGLPHILEHCVLSGSRKYQVREPFVELVKGSLKTYLNAFTGPDRTVYPVASQNLKDFYNLVDVYLDAVFHPLITPHHLQQEGWHYELDKVDDTLVYKGVVFNEMKGVYSSPDNVLGRAGRTLLFPDTPYGVDSGGDPREIPNLTYAQFKAFHERYYHPSNARLFFYGDDPVEKRFAILNEYLSGFTAVNPHSELPLQAPFSQPQSHSLTYGVDGAENLQKKGYVLMNWALPEIKDPQLETRLAILSHVLLGTSGSPLRKTLIDSGLGESVIGGGLSSYMRQMTFGVGLKGVDADNIAPIETLILDSLAQLAESGFDEDLIEAAINTLEFGLRENNTGSMPRGLILFMRVLGGWMYDGDLFDHLGYEETLTAVTHHIRTDKTSLTSLIPTYLLQNPHRLTITLRPDPEHNQRLEADEKARLAEIQAKLSQAEREQIVAQTHELRQRQSTPDSAETLASIPRLKLSDLDKVNKSIPSELLEERPGLPILYHDLFTNGIVYLDLAFNLHQIPADLLPYVGLFGRLLLEMGTEKEDYVKLSQRIGRKTGGIYPGSLNGTHLHSKESITWFTVRGKSTLAQAPDLLDLLRDMLLTVRLDNRDRLRQILLQSKAGKESNLIPSGHGVAGSRLRAQFVEADWVDEQMGGLEALFFVRRLLQEIETDWPAVLARLETVRQTLFHSGAMIVNVTLDSANWQTFQPQLSGFLAGLPSRPVVLASWQRPLTVVNQGLTLPSQGNYVAKGMNIYPYGYQAHGSTAVITNYLRMTWLWEQVRAQGGAYGVFCQFDRYSGLLNYVSYRDPNLLKTLHAYDQTPPYLRQLQLSDDELTKAIIGTISNMDSYQLPDAKGYTAFVRYLLGLTHDNYQELRDQVLGTTAQDFKNFADILEQVARHGNVVVMGSPEAIETANQQSDLNLQTIKIM